MKKIYIITTTALLIAILLTAIPLYSKVFAKVSGTVKSEDGKPVAGAKVILIFSQDGTKYELTTDKNGEWRKVNLRPGEWTIGFMAEGYEPQNITVQFSAIRDNKPIEISLLRTPEAPLMKGDTLYQQKKYAEALEEYQKALAEHPDLYQTYNKIGLCYFRMEELDKAAEAFKKMLEKDPKSQNSLINLSSIYFEQGNLEEGMKYFKQLDEKTLANPQVYYNIGVLFFNNNQIDLAIDNFLKCVALDPNYIDGYYQLALAYLNKGNMEEAKESFQKIIEIAPESEKASLAKKLLENIR